MWNVWNLRYNFIKTFHGVDLHDKSGLIYIMIWCRVNQRCAGAYTLKYVLNECLYQHLMCTTVYPPLIRVLTYHVLVKVLKKGSCKNVIREGFNCLWTSGAMECLRSWSTSVQAMVCCLSQYKLIICKIDWYSYEGSFKIYIVDMDLKLLI